MKFLTTTLARILYALPFGVFGVLHFVKSSQMVFVVPSFMPIKMLWVYLTGAAMILACISILIGKMARLACLLLALMLIIFVVLVHLPNMPAQMSGLLKDISLAGAALFLAGTFKE
jgi:putative oxidoreductase